MSRARLRIRARGLGLGVALASAAALMVPSGVSAQVGYLTSFGSLGSGNGAFNLPIGVAVDRMAGIHLGDVFVVDQVNARVEEFTAGGAYVAQFATGGVPYGLAIDAGGVIWVSDASQNRIDKFVDNGSGFGPGLPASYGSAGSGPLQFNAPRGIAVSGSTIYVADTGNNRVEELSTSGTFVSTFGTAGSGPGQLSGPRDVKLDSAGTTVYVADSTNARVQRFSTTGAPLGSFGTLGVCFGQFDQPRGLVLDSLNHVFVVDFNNHRVQEFTPTGGFIGSFGSSGSAAGQFNLPLAGAVDASDHLYIADTHNNRVQEFGEAQGTPDPSPDQCPAPPPPPPPAPSPAPPTITVSTPAQDAFTDDQPTFSGTAGAPPNADHVIVKLHLVGSNVDVTCPPIAVDGNGSFSGKCGSTQLSDGQWTFTVSQNGDGNTSSATSAQRSFRVDTTAPSVSITTPTEGAAVGDVRPVIGGAASDDPGDNDHVQITTRSFGDFVDQTLAIREGTRWSGRVNKDLNPGQTYTVQAVLTDARGHETSSNVRTFKVVGGLPKNESPPTVSGPAPTVGATLTGGLGTWTTPSGTLRYLGLWSRCATTSFDSCQSVTSGVWPEGRDYKISPEDVGYRMIWTVVASNDAGATTASSSLTGVVPDPDAGSGNNSAGAGNPSIKPPLPARPPSQRSTTCQAKLAFGPIGVTGACLRRVGLTWESTAEVSVNGIHLIPSGGSAKVVIDPMNLRVAAEGQVAIVLGPASPLGYSLGPYTLWKGSFNWIFQPNIQLPDVPGLATAIAFGRDLVKANYRAAPVGHAAINLQQYSYTDLQHLPGLTGLSNLPRIPGLGLPDFSKMSLAELAALRIPTIDELAAQIPAYYLQNVQLPPLALDTQAANIFGFGLDGKAAMQLVDGGANFNVALSLKQFGNLSAAANFKVSNNGQFVTKDVKAHAAEVNLGLVDLRPLDIAFNGATNTWEGGATGYLPFPNPKGLGATVRVVDGKLRRVKVVYEDSLALGTSGVFLNHLDFDYDNGPPTVLTSGIGLSAGPKIGSLPAAIGLDGKFTYVAGDPAKFALTGKASVAGFPLASAGMEYHTNGYFHANGRVGFNVDAEGKYGVSGVVDGWVTKTRFNLAGDVTLRTPGFSLGAHGVVSSVGLAGCATVDGGWFNGFSLGAGYKWGATNLSWIGGSCDMKPYSAIYNGTARAAQAGFSRAFDVPAGERVLSYAVHGRGAPPKLTLRGPGGVTVTTPAASLDGVKTDRYLLIQDDVSDTTFVVVGKPGAGRWTMTAQDSSAPITQVEQAGALPDPVVRAQVRGSGRNQELRWSLTPLEGQIVQFVERSGSVARVLTETGAAAGSLRFTTADGKAGLRRIEAVVLQGGLVRHTLTVARFTAPRSGPARPAHVTARVRHGKLVVTWARAAGAVRYRVLAKVDGGRRLLVTATGKQRTAIIPGVFADSASSVRVVGVDTANRAGPAGQANVKATRVTKPMIKGLKAPTKRP